MPSCTSTSTICFSNVGDVRSFSKFKCFVSFSSFFSQSFTCNKISSLDLSMKKNCRHQYIKCPFIHKTDGKNLLIVKTKINEMVDKKEDGVSF